MMQRTSPQSSGWKWLELLLHTGYVMMSDFTLRTSPGMQCKSDFLDFEIKVLAESWLSLLDFKGLNTES